jgi:hypothetical protein
MAALTIPLDGGLALALSGHKTIAPAFPEPSASGAGVVGIVEPALATRVSGTDTGVWSDVIYLANANVSDIPHWAG